MGELKVVNCVFSGTLGQKLNLYQLFESVDGLSYDPSMYHGAYLRLRSLTVTLYHSGKYIFSGVKDLDSVDGLFSEMLCKLKGFIDESLVCQPELRNIVLMGNLGRALDLNLLYSYMLNSGEEVDYNPEVFPGLFWRSFGATYNVFSSGKYMVLGLKSIDGLDSYSARFEEIVDHLRFSEVCHLKPVKFVQGVCIDRV